MSKLPGAPLIEVIFEIRWTVTNQAERQEVQYLHGDLYPLLKDKFPFRETIQTLPAELLISVPTHRFRTALNDYPLVQVGPGIVTVNTIDSKYYWNEFETLILEVLQKLSEVYNFKESHNAKLVLQYIDLFKFDFEKGDILKYLQENLNISVKQGFYTGNSISKNLVLGLNYENELGFLNINVNRGKDAQGADGIVVQTSLTSGTTKVEHAVIKSWIEKAHELCSNSFKEMTKGNLYEQFKLKTT